MKFFKILKACLRQSIVYEMQYRANLLVNFLTGVGWVLLSYLTMNITGSNIQAIYTNWAPHEYRLFWCLNFLAEGTLSIFFKRNLERIPDNILKGKLDYTLTRPFNSKLLASMGYTRIDNIPGFIFIFSVAVTSLTHIDNGSYFVVNLIFFILFLILASILYYSLIISFVSLSFWLIGAYNLIYLMQQIEVFANYPIKAFGRFLSFVFTFIIPIAFIATFPAETILTVSYWKIIIMILVTLLLYKLSDCVWIKGLKNYSSASS